MKNAITVLACAFIILALIAGPAFAQQQSDLELVGDARGLLLVPEGKKLFDLNNMNPGVPSDATISVRNSYSRRFDLWLKAEDYTAGEPNLLEKLNLTVTYKGKELYSGPVAGFAENSIYLGRIYPGESGELIATVELPGAETDNAFQDVPVA